MKNILKSRLLYMLVLFFSIGTGIYYFFESTILTKTTFGLFLSKSVVLGYLIGGLVSITIIKEKFFLSFFILLAYGVLVAFGYEIFFHDTTFTGAIFGVSTLIAIVGTASAFLSRLIFKKE